MGTIKDRNGMDLREAEDNETRVARIPEKLCKKKGLNDPDNHDGVVTHLEPDILECEVKWALESITMNKANGIPSKLFQILKDDVVEVLHSICQQIWKSGPITSWQIDGETMETLADFIFLGSKITVDCDCRREIIRHLFLGREAMTNLDSLSGSRDVTSLARVHLVKAMVFPVVIYGFESGTIKKAEC